MWAAAAATTIGMLAAATPARALEVEFAPDHKSYSVTHGGKQLFGSTGGIALFCEGKWHTQAAGTLAMSGAPTPVQGTDPALGPFTGVKLSWLAGGTPMTTTARNFASSNSVTFEYQFPKGAQGTSLVELANKTRNEVIVNFPAFTKQWVSGRLSWAGSFVGAVQRRESTGPQGGPTVFFDPLDLSTVVVGSALDNFKSTSAGPGTTYDGTTEAWAPGTPGTIKSLPTGYTQTFLLHAGSGAGITAAIAEWGGILQAVHKTYKVPDVTLQKIGYQTDNGAYYVFCRDANCSKTLLDAVHDLKQLGVPMGYLSFQGAGASSTSSMSDADDENSRRSGRRQLQGPPGAPWCVNTWGPDLHGAQRRKFPLELPDFQQALGVPLQLYAPYFCPGSDYFSRVNPQSNWTSVISSHNISGCHSYGFQDVEPSQSLEFYRWFFAKGKAAGMSSFEPDFMNQNYNCVPDFVESADNARTWQLGMANAALELDLAVQWCYATPTDILAALEMPAVTNFRVSMDFCYGHSWDVGVSSLIVWAAGAYPSKDTLWTSDNGKFAVPGCQWSADHENIAAPLHVVIALMTTGPVGISDMIGGTNVSLIRRTITQDGTLLKPAKPLSAIDSALAAGTGALAVTHDDELLGAATPMTAADQAAAAVAPEGFVYHTYTAALAAPCPAGSNVTDCSVPGTPGTANWTTPVVSSWIFVSFKMTEPYTLRPTDFFPAITQATARGASDSLLVRAFGDGGGCRDGTKASSCGVRQLSHLELQVDHGSIPIGGLTMPVSDQSNVTGGTDYAPVVTTVWPADPCGNGWSFLGDLTKYVAASSNRFGHVQCGSGKLTVTVYGSVGEAVPVTFVDKVGNARVFATTVPAAGSVAVSVPQ